MTDPFINLTKNTYSVRAGNAGELRLTVDGVQFYASPSYSGGAGTASETVSWKVIDDLRKKLEEMEVNRP